MLGKANGGPMKKLTAILALIFCLAALPASAEPFGTKMGDSASRFPEIAGQSGRTFFVKEVPAPQQGFQQYIVTFEGKEGLSAISGLKEFSEKDGGVLNFFNAQNEKLIQEYGPPLRYLDAGWLTWIDSAHPDDKAMKAQLHKYAHYGFGVMWLLKDRDDGLDMVQVTLMAKSESHCTALVTYYFKNYQE
jgi:hypothetical protein